MLLTVFTEIVWDVSMQTFVRALDLRSRDYQSQYNLFCKECPTKCNGSQSNSVVTCVCLHLGWFSMNDPSDFSPCATMRVAFVILSQMSQQIKCEPFWS